MISFCWFVTTGILTEFLVRAFTDSNDRSEARYWRTSEICSNYENILAFLVKHNEWRKSEWLILCFFSILDRASIWYLIFMCSPRGGGRKKLVHWEILREKNAIYWLRILLNLLIPIQQNYLQQLLLIGKHTQCFISASLEPYLSIFDWPTQLL